MKKSIYILIIVTLLSVLVSCGLPFSSVVITDKKEIVLKKYGEIDYIVEGIFIYKNLKEEFSKVDGIDYINNNKGSRGSVEPVFRNNFYLKVDVVKINDEYKLLVYDNVMKRRKNKSKMFVLTDYILPIKIETIINHLGEDIFGLPINQMYYVKKDSSLERPQVEYSDEVTIKIYNDLKDDEVMMSFYSESSGDVIVGLEDNYIYANVIDKVIHYPDNIDYDDFINK